MAFHVGRILSVVMAEAGRGDTWLGKQINKSRGTILDMKKRPHMSTDLLMAASIALEVDLFAYLSAELSRRTGRELPPMKPALLEEPLVRSVLITFKAGEPSITFVDERGRPITAKELQGRPRDVSGTKKDKEGGLVHS